MCQAQTCVARIVASKRCRTWPLGQQEMMRSNAANVGGFVSEFAHPGDVGVELRLGIAPQGSGSDPPEPIRQLAQMLARRAEELVEAGGGPPPSPGDVLLDFDADGIRCLLVVSHMHEQSEIRLSPREGEIAGMVADGYPNKTIAAKLQISSWTVSSYLRKLFVKLGVHSRSAMVARLFEEGLVVDHGEPLWSTDGDERAEERASGVRVRSSATNDR
jgi:DNA-binding CsgD family transcriptional regulator